MPEQNKLPSRTRDELALEKEYPLIAHLLELRTRMMWAVLTIGVIFGALFSFSNTLYTLLATPLLRHLPKGSTMIATQVASPFLTPFKLTLMASIYLAIPVLLYHLWAFIAPGLYKKERKLVWPLLLSSTLLFYGGTAFAYYVVFPLVFGFFASVVPDGVAMNTDISNYLDFVLRMFFSFGVAFEVPVAVILLVWAGIVTPKTLSGKRSYVIVLAFVVGMILAPPDVMSQTLLAVPLWLLFEAGVLVSRLYMPKDTSLADEDPSDGGSAATAAMPRVFVTPPGARPVPSAPYRIGTGKPVPEPDNREQPKHDDT